MTGGRQSKPIHLVKGHRTKAEKELRERKEKELLTGVTLKESKEVKENEIAHKEFLRLKKLLKAIKKDDDLSGNVLNQHCMLVAECSDLRELKIKFEKDLEEFENNSSDEEISFFEKMKIKASLQRSVIDCDKQLMAKRKMLLDIGKENILTIASALRSIPKTPGEENEENPMAAFLKKRSGGNGT